jgi:hypothetical protein
VKGHISPGPYPHHNKAQTAAATTLGKQCFRKIPHVYLRGRQSTKPTLQQQAVRNRADWCRGAATTFTTTTGTRGRSFPPTYILCFCGPPRMTHHHFLEDEPHTRRPRSTTRGRRWLGRRTRLNGRPIVFIERARKKVRPLPPPPPKDYLASRIALFEIHFFCYISKRSSYKTKRTSPNASLPYAARRKASVMATVPPTKIAVAVATRRGSSSSSG